MFAMDSWDAYKIYLGLKLHFSKEGYDFKKYLGKTRAKKENFLKRNDRFFFHKIGRKYGEETVDYFVANLIQNPKGWVGEFNEQVFMDWKKTQQSISYVFRTDMETLIRTESIDSSNFDSLFDCKFGQHPLLLKRFLSGEIHLETMVILNRIFDYVSQFDKDIKETFVWPDKRKLIIKYDSFVQIDVQKCKSYLKNML
jgi:hypothetical protein